MATQRNHNQFAASVSQLTLELVFLAVALGAVLMTVKFYIIRGGHASRRLIREFLDSIPSFYVYLDAW